MRAARYIITDVDETVLVFSEAFTRWMRARGHAPKGLLRDQWGIASTFGVTEETARHELDLFCQSGGYSEIEPEPCALAVLPALRAAGWRFVAVTAVPAEPRIVRARRANLEAAFGFSWEAVHCTGVHGDKRAALSAYDPSVWVEDHWQNAVAGTAFGHDTFLLARTYNRDREHPQVRRVADWHDIARVLEGR